MNPSQKGLSAYYKTIRSTSKNTSHHSFHESGLLEGEQIQLPTGRQNELSFQAILKTQLNKQRSF